jgi:hypothetical protein
MPFENTPFFVDGYFRDRVQGYTVLEMTDTGIRVRYDDGTTETLNHERVQIKARIFTNIIGEYSRHHPVSSETYFETLGYLSRNGRLEAEVPAKSVLNFLNSYQNLTGQRIGTNHTALFLLGEGDKWGPELRIYFPDSTQPLDFGSGVQVRAGQSAGISRINNNALWMRLVSMGFRLGTAHEVDQIRKTIPIEMRASFDRGRTF